MTETITTPNVGLTPRFYSGELNENGRETVVVFNLPGWTSAYIDLLVVMQDVNSNTNQLFYSTQLSAVRQWDQAPILSVLHQQFSAGTGLYEASPAFDGNDFTVTVAQGAFATNTTWKIQVNYMLAR
jgi:hypothetical protein